MYMHLLSKEKHIDYTKEQAIKHHKENRNEATRHNNSIFTTRQNNSIYTIKHNNSIYTTRQNNFI